MYDKLHRYKSKSIIVEYEILTKNMYLYVTHNIRQ